MRQTHLRHGFALSLGFLLFAASVVSGQTTFGFRGGVTVSSADIDIAETFDDSNRTGFTGGVFLDLGGSSPLGFQVGAQYTQKGVELDFGDVVEDLSLNYLEIPAVVKVGIPLGAVKPSLLGGLAAGFRTSCDYARADCDEEFESIEWAGIVGADLAVYLGTFTLFVDGRYHFGLNNISDAVDLDELKNRAWAFQGGLGFPVGG